MGAPCGHVEEPGCRVPLCRGRSRAGPRLPCTGPASRSRGGAEQGQPSGDGATTLCRGVAAARREEPRAATRPSRRGQVAPVPRRCGQAQVRVAPRSAEPPLPGRVHTSRRVFGQRRAGRSHAEGWPCEREARGVAAVSSCGPDVATGSASSSPSPSVTFSSRRSASPSRRPVGDADPRAAETCKRRWWWWRWWCSECGVDEVRR